MTTNAVVRIQTVLYLTLPGTVARYLRGLSQAVRHARLIHPGLSVELCFADCSPEALLADPELVETRNSVQQNGLASFSYQFLGANLGHGGGQNHLLEQRAGSDYVLILNPDTCLSPRALVELLAAMDDPTVGIAEARQLPLEHQKAFDLVTGDTSWASGACSLIRTQVFNDIGLYDTESFFLYCDDVDFSWRTRLAGYRVVVQPSARVFHDKRLSVTGAYVDSENERYHSALASVLLAWKYSRADVLQGGLGYIDSSTEEILHKAASEFRRREADGTLPQQLDSEGRVGQFQTYAFADVRY